MMIPDNKFYEILGKLLAKAKADEIRWQRDHELADEETSAFSIRFAASRLYVQYESPPTEPDQIELGIENLEGDPIKRIVVQEDDGDPHWTLAYELYQEAARSVTGWDRVLTEIEGELDKKGAIGLP
jgi:hypothetical protein